MKLKVFEGVRKWKIISAVLAVLLVLLAVFGVRQTSLMRGWFSQYGELRDGYISLESGHASLEEEYASLAETYASFSKAHLALWQRFDEIRSSFGIAMSYYPDYLTHRAGESIEIYAHSIWQATDLKEYEFCVWELDQSVENSDWVQIAPYQDFKPLQSPYGFQDTFFGSISVTTPVYTYRFGESAMVSLQVDIRHKASGAEDKIWLGQFYVHDFDETENRSVLMRQISSMYMDVRDKGTLYGYLARDMDLFARLYHGFSRGEEAAAKADIDTLYSPDWVDGERAELAEEAGTRIRRIDFAARRIEYDGFSIDVSPGSHPSVDAVIDTLGTFDPDVIRVGILNHLIYTNYDYGAAQPRYMVPDPRYTKADCEKMSADLYAVLANLGISATRINASIEGASVHQLCELQLAGEWYSFDPTANVVHLSAAENIEDEETVTFYLPQIRNMEHLISKEYWNQVTDINADWFGGEDPAE